MTNTAILAASALLLFAYALEHFGRRFRLPTVVLLIVAGLIARQILEALGPHGLFVNVARDSVAVDEVALIDACARSALRTRHPTCSGTSRP